MFKRPHSTKTIAPLRSSDLRKLRDQLSLAFPPSRPYAKQVLPDGTLAAKASTHLDEPVTLYFSPAERAGLEPDPRLIRIGKGQDGLLVPTCYLFDLVPDLLPVLETAPQVVDNLQSGSALFTAGVSLRSLENLPESIRPGDLVAVVVYGHPETVVAVGTLGASKQELVKDDKKGKAVLTLHARGDFLWNSGSKVEQRRISSEPRSSSPAPSTASSSAKDSVDEAAAALASTKLTPSQARAPEPQDSPDSSPAAPPTPAEVDEILHDAVLRSIQLVAATSPFPLPASSFYSSHILPNRPVHVVPAQTDLKKSSYKKLSGLVKVAQKKGWLTSKDVKGETLIMSVNASHPDVDALRPYKTLAQQAASDAKAAAGSNGSDPTSTSSGSAGPTTGGSRSRGGANPGPGSSNGAQSGGDGGQAVVVEYLKPSSTTVKEILGHIPHERPTNDLYPPYVLKTLFTSYLSTHSLIHPNSPKHFTLVPSASPVPLSLESIAHQELVAGYLVSKHEKVETDFPDGVMTKDEGFKRFKGGFSPFWSLRTSSSGGDGTGDKVRKGSPPIVKVSIKNVGKRQVTLISGHEGWELFSSEELAEELKHKSASSTS
ncbi:hypothetical protein JCM10212_000575, partial [Sporobolomyces blumeae]